MKKNKIKLGPLAGILLMGFIAANCAHNQHQEVVTEFSGKSGYDLIGQAKLVGYQNDTVSMDVNITGLEPNSLHGFHIHEKGDCSADDASSAGDHFSPHNEDHGSPTHSEHHLGDLGNLQADSNGIIRKELLIDGVNLKEKSDVSILDRALVLHARADDYVSQPSGDSGTPIACAVIR